MFLVDDTIEQRHTRIREFRGDQIMIGPLLAAIDFEWTVRRAILILGWESTTSIRAEHLRRCSGLDAYKDVWTAQVMPLHSRRLPQVVPDWAFLRSEAYGLRHRIVHGRKNSVGGEYAEVRRDCLLAGSRAVTEFVRERGGEVYRRLPIRKTAQELPR